jgi:AcrR family transcriptional regulator
MEETLPMVATLDIQAPVRRKVGRPRAFQDEDVFRVMVSVVSEVGYSGLTFALVAAQIHCTTSALIRRFGDKEMLVQRFITWISTTAEANSESTLSDLTPLDRIYAGWFSPRSEKGRAMPEMYLTFFVEARSNPAYRPQLAQLTDGYTRWVTKDLNEAVSDGSLKSSTDIDQVARLLVSAVIGAISIWVDHQRGTVREVVTGVLDVALAPYRT